MTQETIRVFLVEDNPGDAHLVRRYLSKARRTRFEIDEADRLAPALERIAEGPVDLIVLDLSLPDSTGIDTFRETFSAFPEIPILVMTGLDDRDLALRAVREGAQDYLVKSELGSEPLLRSIAYAIERKRSEGSLREKEQRYERAVDGTRDGLWDWDLRSERVHYSRRWKEMLGYDEEIGDGVDEWFERVHPGDLDRLKREISDHLAGKSSSLHNEHRIRDARGSYRWVLARARAVRGRDGAAYRLAGSLSDIDSRKHTEQQLMYDAMHDPLTGLANSALLVDRLEVALGQAQRTRGARFAVLFLDLDEFKRVNDSQGHAIGDQLLVGVALRLQALLRPGDTVARLGGDEFAVLAHGIENPSDATRIAERIHEELRKPFELGGLEVVTSTSIGIALSATGYQRPDDLLHDADTAMYRAKFLGHGRHAIFDEEMHRRAIELLRIENDLRRAIQEEELRLLYQPIVALESGSLQAFEALVRWEHPERGLLVPSEFIPVAEQTGLIVPLGWFVLRHACGQMATWHRQLPDTRKLAVSVNLSPKQFRQPDLAERIEHVLEQTGLEPSGLELEITERSLMENAETVVTKLKRLRDLGVRLNIDDFGTGFSSLAYLHQLPTQTVEIDRSFVRGLCDPDDRSRVVDTIVSLARSLGMQVAAEGLETGEQLDRLKKLRCDYGQGYFFSKPLAQDEARALIASQPRW